MRRIGFPDVFRAVAWGMNDFSNHSTPIKSSVQPFEDVATLKSIGQHRESKLEMNPYTISGWLSNHSGENNEPGNMKPGLSSVPSAQIASIMVMSSRLALRCLYFARCLRE